MAVQFSGSDVVKALKGDAEFRLASRAWTSRIRIDQVAHSDDLVIVDGTVLSFGPSAASSADVALTAPESEWPRLLAGDPDLQFAFEIGENGFRIDGDLLTQLAPYGPAIRRLLKVLRQVSGTPAPERHITEYPYEASDVAVGRYVYYTVDDVRYRVYYEEAGSGIPLLLQHTAGADSRQWRHLLADPELQKRYRMIAYDLPFHGKSLPPLQGPRWWQDEYAPSKEDLLARIVGLKRALNVERPIFMGVSVGGQLAPEVIAHYPDDFRAAISVNGFFHMDALAGLSNEPFHHPQISPEYFASLMYESTSPLAPEEFRRESWWIYASNGPAVYKGDNAYYSAHDLRQCAHLIDTSRTPLYAVVGEFDPANYMAGGTREIAENIPGTRFILLEGQSHFAMSDDPVRFNAAITPILDDIAADADAAQLLATSVHDSATAR